MREIFLHSSLLVNRIVAGPWQFKVFQGLPNCTNGKSQGFFLADFNSRDGVFLKKCNKSCQSEQKRLSILIYNEAFNSNYIIVCMYWLNNM